MEFLLESDYESLRPAVDADTTDWLRVPKGTRIRFVQEAHGLVRHRFEVRTAEKRMA